MSDLDARDELENNLLATGAVYAALWTAPGIDAEVVEREGAGVATNRIRFRLPFMKSAYILTVEREPESDKGTQP